MDYPQLNFLFGAGLLVAEGISIALFLLFSRTRLPPAARGIGLATLGLSVLVCLYILFLFVQKMTPGFNLNMLVLLLVIGVLVFLAAALFRRVGLSTLAGWLAFAFFILCNLIALGLAYGLFRAMVPV